MPHPLHQPVPVRGTVASPAFACSLPSILNRTTGTIPGVRLTAGYNQASRRD